ncbi:non-ribosomal peptide synthetase [Colwellia psychrerythraea]|uniref:Amino acid adenylation domain protein n=1 Tax=Colwellia psychrerythraea TaxID=28229 RepID=A0A099K9P3_COLPS|nr:non-ribosomal peptide synthetase [Colwellia psychrerythraea]KGJ86782.1 amino acid adenylation domain protein [Colwellia psychrerythraea]
MALIAEQIIKKSQETGVYLFIEKGALGFKQTKGARFDADLKRDIQKHKAEIIDFLSLHTKTVHRKEITKIDQDTSLIPMSFAQQRLWLLDKIDGGSCHYHMPAALTLSGELNLDALEFTFNKIIQRHESLRTVFREDDDGQAVQVILQEVIFTLPLTDLSNLQGEVQTRALTKAIEQDAVAPFDLSRSLMLRASVLKLGETVHVLLFNMHHIASDGWSMGILLNEFSSLYTAFSQGQPDPLTPLDIQYADYAHWQRNWLQDEVLDEQLGYWKKQLAGLPAVHSLPLGKIRPAVQNFNGQIVSSHIQRSSYDTLYRFCQVNGATLFMGLQAAFAVLLARYSNETDIVMGTSIANREQPEVAGLIGFFVNNLVLRNDLSANPSFRGLLNQSKAMLLDAYAHQQIPFELIVETLQPARSLNHSPLFQVMLVLQNNEEGTLELPGLTLLSSGERSRVAKYDLTLNVTENEYGLQLDWEYDSDLFERSTIALMAGSFERLLITLLQTPDKSVFEVGVLSEAQIHHLVHELNDTQADYPKDKCIHEFFEQQAELNPNNIAVVFEDKQLTYKQLNEKSNQLAHYLKIQHDIKPDTLVGLCVERSLEMVIGIIAILKAGGAYVPLDPSYPQDRISYMLEDAQLELVLSQVQVQKVLSGFNGAVVMLDGLGDTDENHVDSQSHFCSRYGKNNLTVANSGLTSSHLAYVIYTSGSTGQPKGVMIEHQAFVNFALSDQRHLCYDSNSKILNPLSISFDAGNGYLLGGLLSGSCVYIGHEIKRGGAYLFDIIEKNKITHAVFPYSVLDKSSIKVTNSLKYLISGGGNINSEVISLLEEVNLINCYGPTEATVTSTFAEMSVSKLVTIGRPIDNCEAYLFSSVQQLLPLGVVGELYIGGAGLARGYLNRPELTAECFISNPFYDKNKANSAPRLYRTGDLVRYLADGNLEFIGRADDQVKIRGFRIELGEVEAQLTQLDSVDSALVMAKELAGSQQLVGYVKPQNAIAEQDVANYITAAKASLGQQLPEYMVPNIIMLVEQWPLTPNGKIDKKSLPTPDGSCMQGEYLPPETKAEKSLVVIWADLLDLNADTISITANFFELGGHSLLIIQLVARIKKLGLSIDVPSVYKSANLQVLASILVNADTDAIDFVVPENLIPENCDYITPEMLPLVDLMQSELDDIFAKVPGGASNIQDIYPLAELQKGILYIHNVTEQRDPYVILSYYELSNEQSLEHFISCLNFTIERYDVLRTAVLWRNRETALQVVYKEAQLPIEYLNFDNADNVREAFFSYADNGAHRIELETAPLIQLQVVKDEQSGQYLALLKKHHLLIDNVSIEIIMSEVALFQRGMADSLPVPVLYREFIARTLHNHATLDIEGFFTQQLGDVEEATLPFGLSDVTGDGSDIVELHVDVGEEVSTRIRKIMRQEKQSPASFFHTAWSMVLSVCCGHDDVVFGTVLSGRMNGDENSENALGMMINTLPLRVTLNDLDAKLVVQQVHDGLLSLIPYEQASLAQAQRCSGLGGSVPLFSANLNYRHNKVETFKAEINEVDNEIQTYETAYITLGSQERTNYPFNLSVNDNGKSQDFSFDFQIDKSVEVQRIADYMQTAVMSLLEALEQDDKTPVKQISVLPNTEIKHLVHELNETCSDYPKDKCIHELFEQKVEENPDNIALVFKEQQLTYKQLNDKSNQLAHYLLDNHDIKPDTLVGLCVERSLEMVVGILAILKAGGAYVPLDPEYPEDRLKYMIEDAELKTVLTQSSLSECKAVSKEQALYIDELLVSEQINEYSAANISKTQYGLQANHLAYVIYTSGSTGQPKGVMVEHEQLNNLLNGIKSQSGCDKQDQLLAVTSLCFDIHTLEIFLPITNGATLIIAPKRAVTTPENLQNLIEKHHVTIMQATPSTWKILVENNWQPEHKIKVLCGGEVLTEQLKNALLKRHNIELWNMYGPTETCVWSATAQMSLARTVDIGAPVGNTSFYLLDDKLKLVPHGLPGELHIGGVGLARGYLNRADLTAEKFIENPFYDKDNCNSSERLYKTGDFVQRLPDGKLKFLSRIDHQVKIRGFRIELGEIEHVLSTHFTVKDVVVLGRENNNGDKHLSAYIVPTKALDLESEDVKLLRYELKSALKQVLPEYMIPLEFILLDKFPLTNNGKFDRKSLLAADFSQEQTFYVKPSADSEKQKQLCDIWQNILGVKRVGITDDFFELGGDSIIALRLINVMEQHGLSISIGQLWTHRTIEALCDSTVFDLIDENEHDLPITMLDKGQCLIEHFEIDTPFNETYLRYAINKLLSNELLNYKVIENNGEHVLVAANRSRKEKNSIWQILDETVTDVDNFIEKQSRRLNDKIMALNGDLIGLAYLNHNDRQICIIATHSSLIDENNWHSLLANFKNDLIKKD